MRGHGFHRHTDGRAMVREIAEMGFDTVEVSHGLRLPLLPGIQEAVNHGEIRVCGVHNFCPSPVEVVVDAPDCYEFTSDLKLDRERAVSMTLKTLETAADLSAEYVVLHLGSIPMPRITDKRAGCQGAAGGGLGSKVVWLRAVEIDRDRDCLCLRQLNNTLGCIQNQAQFHSVLGLANVRPF